MANRQKQVKTLGCAQYWAARYRMCLNIFAAKRCGMLKCRAPGTNSNDSPACTVPGVSTDR